MNNRGATQRTLCKNCKGVFFPRVADIKRGWGKFCDKSCKARHQERKTGQHRNFLISKTNGGNFIFGAAEDCK